MALARQDADINTSKKGAQTNDADKKGTGATKDSAQRRNENNQD